MIASQHRKLLVLVVALTIAVNAGWRLISSIAPALAAPDDGQGRETPAAPRGGGTQSGLEQISHQGVVSVNGQRFTGTGQFRFAIVDPGTSVNRWTNDGSRLGEAAMPNSAVSRPVVNGVYSVRLGDTAIPEMTMGISPTVYNKGDLRLRIWFEDDGGNGVRQLSPDQPLTSTPYSSNGVPPGTISAFGGEGAPPGWLLCDGQAVSRTAYPALFEAIRTAWGAGDGSTTVHLPDLRGRFLRGVDMTSGRDPDVESRGESAGGGNSGNNVGSIQSDATRRPHNPFKISDPGNHTHEMMGGNRTGRSQNPGDYLQGTTTPHEYGSKHTAGAGAHSHSILDQADSGDAETRPVNASVHYIIKF